MHWQTNTIAESAAPQYAPQPTAGPTVLEAPAPEVTSQSTIRSATMDDIDAIVKIGREGFIHAHQGAFAANDLETLLTRWFSYETIFYDILSPRTHYFVSEVNGVICGMVRMDESEKPSYIPGSQTVELTRLYLDVDHIGRGLGTALMNHAILWSAQMDYDTMWLHVWEKNPRALRFYQKWGFLLVGSKRLVVGESSATGLVMGRAI